MYNQFKGHDSFLPPWLMRWSRRRVAIRGSSIPGRISASWWSRSARGRGRQRVMSCHSWFWGWLIRKSCRPIKFSQRLSWCWSSSKMVQMTSNYTPIRQLYLKSSRTLTVDNLSCQPWCFLCIWTKVLGWHSVSWFQGQSTWTFAVTSDLFLLNVLHLPLQIRMNDIHWWSHLPTQE